MTKKISRRIFVPLIALCLVLSSSIVSFASEDINSWFSKTREELNIIGEGGVPLQILTENENNSRMADLTSEISGTSTGYINSSFVVPSQYDGQGVKIAWGAKASDSNVNTTVVLKVYNSSGSRVATVYLPVTSTTTADGYSLGSLAAGTYTYTISPNGTSPGEFVYIMKFYVYP